MNFFRRIINWFKKTKTLILFLWKGKKFVIVWTGDGWGVTIDGKVLFDKTVFCSSEAAIEWIKEYVK